LALLARIKQYRAGLLWTSDHRTPIARGRVALHAERVLARTRRSLRLHLPLPAQLARLFEHIGPDVEGALDNLARLARRGSMSIREVEGRGGARTSARMTTSIHSDDASTQSGRVESDEPPGLRADPHVGDAGRGKRQMQSMGTVGAYNQ
jgi:hypothetical protein